MGPTAKAADTRPRTHASTPLYDHARLALYATLESGSHRRRGSVPSSGSTRKLSIATTISRIRITASNCASRIVELVAGLYSSERPPPVQIVVSDGLNARAINEQLPALLPALQQSTQAGGHSGQHDSRRDRERTCAGGVPRRAVD